MGNPCQTMQPGQGRLYLLSNTDQEDSNNVCLIPFGTQSAPDIRKKLENLENFKGINRSQLLEVVQRVFNHRERIGMRFLNIN